MVLKIKQISFIVVLIITSVLNSAYGNDNKLANIAQPDLVFKKSEYRKTFIPGKVSKNTMSDNAQTGRIYRKVYIEEKKAKAIIESREQILSLNVWPIPAENNVELNIIAEEKSNSEITLFNGNGRIIERKVQLLNAGRNKFSYCVATFDPGSYYFVVNCGSTISTAKLLVVR